ncbi:hypothetical protein [Planomonospora parontospora]|uniref:hypothetical protein n=1 Tax=Planomonospora parontospora TaxID=58119 RepID=UPI00166FA1D7|nr:hypothetical protein [Planomonospora parontospora]
MIKLMSNGRIPGLLAVLTLTAACGGAGGTTAAPSTAPLPPSSLPSEQSTASQTQTREVTLEVNGKGKVMQPIVYTAGSSGSEADVTLPWKKTVTVELTEAEQKVGVPVSIIPGSVRDSGGMLKPASCRILVDGEEVATSGAEESMCKYTLK